MTKEIKSAVMIPSIYLSQLPFQIHFDQCCCCNTSLPGTRPIQWGWKSNGMVVDVGRMWKESTSITLSVYKEHDKMECSNCRGISLLRWHTKFYPIFLFQG